MTILAWCIAWVLDFIIGDPQHWPHPVRWIGRLITFVQRIVRRYCPGDKALRIGGGVMWVVVVGATWGLGAARCGLPVLLDGFLSYSAALAACQIAPAVRPYLIPSHFSAEKGARIALAHLSMEPYLHMAMRLGEGSGAALAMPIVEAACAMFHNMGELAASNIVLPEGNANAT